MNRCDIAFTPVYCGDTAEAADRQGPRRKAAVSECSHNHIECDIVAPHNNQIHRVGGAADQCDACFAIGAEC